MRLGRIKIGRALLVGTAIVAVVLCIVWSQRRPIAAGAIDRALAARGVSASYEIKDIGFRTHRIEHLRLGDPANPDLTADWAEVSLVPTWSGISVAGIDAGGVRLRGRVVQGRASWGAIDKLLPASNGEPLTLPDIDVRLADTRVMLATDIGALTADVAGSGKLSSGFSGRARVTAPFVGRDGCRAELPVVDASFTIVRRQPQIKGTLATQPSTCASVEAGPTRSTFDVTLNEAFDHWDGSAKVQTDGIRLRRAQFTQLAGEVVFAGSAIATKGRFTAKSAAALYADTRMTGIAVDGEFGAGKTTTAQGHLNIARVLADPAQIATLRRAFAGAEGTPVGPLAAALSAALARAGDGATVDTDFNYANASSRLSAVRVAARGGGVLTLGNGSIVVDASGVSAAADLALAGGGFPSVQGRFVSAADGTTRGSFGVAPYRVGNAQLILAPVTVAIRRDGALRIETVATIDGPIGDGRAEGVRAPVIVQRTSSGDIAIAPGCTPVAYRRIALAGTTLAPGSITLCPTRGGAIVRSMRNGIAGGARTGPLRLTGRVGDQPMELTASGASFELGGPLSLADFTAQLGSADRRTLLKIARLDGVTRVGGLAGCYTGLSGNIARVPLLASEGRGNWAFSGGVLDVSGRMRIADQADAPRFNPVVANDIKLRLKDGRIAASTTLHEPTSGKAVVKVDLTHDLSRTTGTARLTVDGLFFGKSLQPDMLTKLTKGVVQLVQGSIDGTGTINWTPDGVTSGGSFKTDGLDFAAAFGPVTGASGAIVFDDLLTLSTPPGQRVHLTTVNPGVEVNDGTIAYQLRPDQVVAIEGGRWPFAGGELLLDPATLDFGQSKPRRLTFRIDGLDAAKFIDTLKLQDIAATGIFDGALPITFDATGGQIVGGRLVARASGGTLAYVGDVSNAQTNTMARLAFDALKSIRYQNLAIDLDGALDGEIISKVGFTGTNQAAVKPTGLLRAFTGLPFKFNIVVRAPFRGLVNSARGLQDPGVLIDRTVQPGASVTRP